MKTILPVCFYFFSSLFNICFAQQPRLMLPIGHTQDIIYNADFSPDGKYILSGSKAGAMLWETVSGRLLQTLKGNSVGRFGHQGKTIINFLSDSDSTGAILISDLLTGRIVDSIAGTSINFNASGDRALIASENNTIRYWDYRNKKAIFDLEGDLAFFILNDKYILSVIELDKKKEEYNFNIWETGTKKLLRSFIGEFNGFSDEYLCLAEDSVLRIYNFLTGDTLQTFSRPENKYIKGGYLSYKNKFTRDKKHMVAYETRGADHAILFDTRDFKMKKVFYFNETISNVFLSPDSKFFIAAYDAYKKLGAIALNIETGDTLFYLKGHTKHIRDLTFSPDHKFILTTSVDATAILWDAFSGTRLRTFKGKNAEQSYCETSPDGKYFSFLLQGNLLVYETSTFKKILSLPEEQAEMSFTPDSRHLLIGRNYLSSDGYPFLKKLNILTGSTVYSYSYKQDSTDKYYYPIDGSLIALLQHDAGLIIYNEKQEKLLTIKKQVNEDFGHVVLSADKKYCIVLYWVDSKKPGKYEKLVCYMVGDGKISWIYTGKLFLGDFEINEVKHQVVFRTSNSDNSLVYLNLSDGQVPQYELINEHRLEPGFFTQKTIVFSPDGNYISVRNGSTIYFYDFRTAKPLLEVPNNFNTNSDFVKFLDGSKVLISRWHGVTEIWDIVKKTKIGTKKINGFIINAIGENYIVSDLHFLYLYDKNFSQICSFINLGIDDYILLIEGGYYQSTQNAAKLLYYVTKDLKTISFEQLDVKYNRPDKVLEAVGSTDTTLIRSYRKAYEKRIKKLGIDTTAFRSGFSVPEADFANRYNIIYEQTEGKLKLNITGADSTYKIDRFNIWINETPLYGQRGVRLRSKNKRNFDSTVIINLSQGENIIETSITNVNGTESYRIPLLVNYTPAGKQAEKTYFIGIGIDQFVDSKYNLKYSTKDIRDLSKKLKEKYKDIVIDTLFNDSVTISNVKALKQKLQQTSVNDRVIISYSGHGMLSKDFDYYLSTYAVNFDKPEENGLPYDELESLLDSIPARKKLLLIDACHSGEVDKEDLVALNATDEKLIKGLKPVAYKNEGHLGLKNSFELMQSLFVNVGKSTGATIISAAAGTQFALEGIDNLPNGVFTYCILEAMNKYPSMKISELKTIVGERVVEITRGLQKPTSRNETIAVDWSVW